MNNHLNLLSCWHKLEHFSPATLPKSSDDNVEKLLREQEPWKVSYSSKNKSIEYTIFLGVFDSQVVVDFVDNFFNNKKKDENYRSSKISFASLKLDEEGKYINDSFGLSTLPWALAQLEHNKIEQNDWSKNFEDIKAELLEYIDLSFKEVITDSEGEILKISRVVNYSQLIYLQDKIEKICNWSIKHKKDIYYKWVEIHKSNESKSRNESRSTSDTLNSFFIKDLEKIIANYNEKTLPKAFKQYLEGSLNNYSERINVFNDIDILKTNLLPSNIPDGCWPSEYTLSLMQQFAVNTIFNELNDENQAGLFSVNGPPGTGKTTLLRDIIAPIIVTRAKELLKIETPSKAFKKIGEIEATNKFTSFIYEPIKSITNGGIVIASSNNGAVENISKELPLKKEVSEIYSNKISYFKDVAEGCIHKDNWGIISAVLGNKENRDSMVKSLWFNKEFSDLRKTLKENKFLDDSEWKKVQKEFKNKLREIEKEKERLTQFVEDNENFIITDEALKKLIFELKNIEITYKKSSNDLKIIQDKVETLQENKVEILNELSIIKNCKPKFFDYLFSSAKRKAYKKALNNLLNLYNQITENIAVATTNLSRIEKKNSELRITYSIQNASKDTLSAQLERLSIKVSEAKNELKNNYADISFWNSIETQQSQEASPWYSQELKKLNSELFIISLKLNEIFILTANGKSDRISSTLSGFFEYLKGYKKVSKTEVKAMWNTFFLVVPVVSSALASIQTMFKDLEQEDLPWLFIDEAGQAVPQAAAGVIWRSKRVGVVGDPFQIEPVVTIPNSITDHISQYFDLTNSQINSTFSTQSMADRINRYGSYMIMDGKEEWIGIPLRIHRRCIDPMFKISNSIAYNNTMFNSTSLPEKIKTQFKTAFIDVKGNVEGRHYVHNQAEKVKELLIQEINYTKDLPNVFVISPFSEISYKLKSFLFHGLIIEIEKYKKIESVEMNEWLKSHIGTVHTFQGKQADGVIFCLGLDQKTKNSATWASQKPNLLNVAITRAKYRFIAIGDEDIWLKQPYFSELRDINQ